MSSHAGPSRLPSFHSHSASPIGISSRRKAHLHGLLSLRRKTRCSLFLVVSSTVFIGLFVTLFKTLRTNSPLLLSSSSSRYHVRRWVPQLPQEARRPYSLSAYSFLPDPDMFNADNQAYSQAHLSSGDYGDTITAILPVTSNLLSALGTHMVSILSVHSSILREIIIACHPSIVSRTELALEKVILPFSMSTTVLPWGLTDNHSLGVLHILPSVVTTHVLLLDPTALHDIDDITRMTLLNTGPSMYPVGPHGLVISSTNISCALSPGRTVPAAYLVPPFLSSTLLLRQAENGMRLGVDGWAALGERIAKKTGAGFGGLAVNLGIRNGNNKTHRWCADAVTNFRHNPAFLQTFHEFLERGTDSLQFTFPRVDILLPAREDLEAFGPTACEMAQRGSTLRVMLFSWSHVEQSAYFVLDVGCHLHFETIPRSAAISTLTRGIKTWMQAGDGSDVLIYSSQSLVQTMAIQANVETLRHGAAVQLPADDLPFCEWMSALSVSDWQNWHKPRIDLSVITNDRPRSLSRLLTSLTAARYFGDPVQLKINLEQTADLETREIVADFRWKPGVMHVQHRIISAGLLPAVVEAWYPHTNDSYGVLLEDDVELSPMFYAWLKMSIIRYRYGSQHDSARSLYGISLYQPINLELRPKGRVPFEPRSLFAEHALPDSRTPYLSQVPCSWGAVYFPEHFREFHDYLALRLSEATHNISEAIVPDIRSNRWMRSWKKYFNELVYLRGYVMLYPNYDLSLATNHVEVGAHVKSTPKHSLKSQFNVALMPLPSVSVSETRNVSLLDIPDGTLPAWSQLPVLDLWGVITSHSELIQHGRERHKLLSRCPPLSKVPLFTYDASELLCAPPPR